MKFKKCPECFTNLSMEIRKCPSCDQKLKQGIDKHGYAKKVTDWKSYFLFLLSFVGVIAFIWWAFSK